MKQIRQLIVVEGRHDSARLKEFFLCDTIETGGTSLGEEVIERIRQAQKSRGVIIFTDPDSPGNRIRNAINQAVPGCANAFIDKKAARTDHKVGVEHADRDDLEAALANVVVYEEKPQSSITMEDLYELGLCGSLNSASLREQAGNALHIGMANAKTMLKRMNYLGITKEELRKVIQ